MAKHTNANIAKGVATAKMNSTAGINVKIKTANVKHRICTQAIKAKVREVRSAQGENGPALSMSELMTFFSELIGPDADASIPQHIKDFAACLVKFRRGEVTKKQMMNDLLKICDARNP